MPPVPGNPLSGIRHAMGQADKGQFASDKRLRNIFGRALISIRVSEDAADDLENIKARIARDDGAAAECVVEQIRAMIRVLGELPQLGYDGIVEGTYERTVSRTPYVIVYRIDLGSKDELIIQRVPRSSQERSRYHY